MTSIGSRFAGSRFARSLGAVAIAAAVLAPVAAGLGARAELPPLCIAVTLPNGTTWQIGSPNTSGECLSLPASTPPSKTNTVSCNLVIGFSQTRDWFNELEASSAATGIDPAQWELRAAGGAGVNRWADPNNEVWTTRVTSPCASNASSPERVIFTISAQTYETSVSWWEEQTRAAIDQIRVRYPRVQQIVLQPVVGGPNHLRCVDPATGSVVRASFNHPYIQQAIGRIIESAVVRGADPHARRCADYRDVVGHLTDDGNAYQGQTLGTFYARFPNP